jgi:hypothetical protein
MEDWMYLTLVGVPSFLLGGMLGLYMHDIRVWRINKPKKLYNGWTRSPESQSPEIPAAPRGRRSSKATVSRGRVLRRK